MYKTPKNIHMTCLKKNNFLNNIQLLLNDVSMYA